MTKHILPSRNNRSLTGDLIRLLQNHGFQVTESLEDFTIEEPEPMVRIGTGVIVVKDNKILTGIRQGSHGSGRRAFPGGHVDLTDKSLEEAGEREVFEETGMAVKVRQGEGGADFIRTFDILSECGKKRYVTLYMIADYIAGGSFNEDGSVVPLEPQKCQSWEWNSLEELIALVGDENDAWIPIKKILARRDLLKL